MKQTESPNSRRAFMRTSALGLGALGAGRFPLAHTTADASGRWGVIFDVDAKQPASEIAVWFTNGRQRFAAGRPIVWQPASTPPTADSIQLVVANKFQDILGFGGCFS